MKLITGADLNIFTCYNNLIIIHSSRTYTHFISLKIFLQRYKSDGMEMGEPYYAPKEEPLHAKDSAQLRKIEERDKQIKYAKKLGECEK